MSRFRRVIVGVTVDVTVLLEEVLTECMILE